MKIIKLSALISETLKKLKEETPQMAANAAQAAKGPQFTGSEAAAQAHQLGLVSAGWGRWKDNSGQVVAKTIGGHLVKTTDQDGQNSDHEVAHYNDFANPATAPVPGADGDPGTDIGLNNAASYVGDSRHHEPSPEQMYPGYKPRVKNW